MFVIALLNLYKGGWCRNSLPMLSIWSLSDFWTEKWNSYLFFKRNWIFIKITFINSLVVLTLSQQYPLYIKLHLLFQNVKCPFRDKLLYIPLGRVPDYQLEGSAPEQQQPQLQQYLTPPNPWAHQPVHHSSLQNLKYWIETGETSSIDW